MTAGLYRALTVAWLISLVCAAGPAETVRASIGPHDIVVQPDGETGGASLLTRVTRLPFIATGHNYIRIDSVEQRGNTFDVGVYDAMLTESVFQQMQGYGYTTVRLFVWPSMAGNPTGPGLSDGYLANVTDAIHRAVTHGMRPILSIIGLPRTGGYRPATPDPPEYATAPLPAWAGTPVSSSTPGGPTRLDANEPAWYTPNWYFFTAQARDARIRYLTDMLAGLVAHGAPLASVLAYDLTGEMLVTQTDYPLSAHSGTTLTKTGTYDLSSASDRQRMIDDNLIYAVNSEAAAIKAVDPNAVTSVQLAPGATNPDPKIYIYPSGAALRAFAIDLITLSLYPTYDKSMDALIASFGTDVTALGKPLLIMEMGYFSYYLALHPELTLADLGTRIVQWERDSCRYGVRGSLFFTWDVAHSDAPYFNATENNNFFAAALSPHANPDLCGVLAVKPVQAPRVSDAPRGAPAPPVPPTRATAPGGVSSAPAPLPIGR